LGKLSVTFWKLGTATCERGPVARGGLSSRGVFSAETWRHPARRRERKEFVIL